jgi:hypothetical protein
MAIPGTLPKPARSLFLWSESARGGLAAQFSSTPHPVAELSLPGGGGLWVCKRFPWQQPRAFCPPGWVSAFDFRIGGEKAIADAPTILDAQGASKVFMKT